MPRLDGVQATARIRSHLPEVQVAVFSSTEGAGMVIARQAGASAFVAKGASAEQVCAAVLAAWSRPPPPNQPLTAPSSCWLMPV
jgi:DNA-binding NarL/FixJ family response regulator